mgnify:CR=1 FL=1
MIVDFQSLPLSKRLHIAWGFFWRGMLTTLGSSLCGWLSGVLVGFFLTVPLMRFGMDPKISSYVAAAVGMIIGTAFFWAWVVWMFQSRLGGFKLALVRLVEDLNSVAG